MRYRVPVVPLSAQAERNTHISREIVTRIRAIPAKPHYTFTPSSVRRSGKGRPVKTATRFLPGVPLRKDINSREKEKARERDSTHCCLPDNREDWLRQRVRGCDARVSVEILLGETPRRGREGREGGEEKSRSRWDSAKISFTGH